MAEGEDGCRSVTGGEGGQVLESLRQGQEPVVTKQQDLLTERRVRTLGGSRVNGPFRKHP